MGNEEGMSWETTDVLSADTTDVLSADTTDVLSADTTDVLSADTTNCCPVGFPWTVSDQSQMNESPPDRPEYFPTGTSCGDCAGVAV